MKHVSYRKLSLLTVETLSGLAVSMAGPNAALAEEAAPRVASIGQEFNFVATILDKDDHALAGQEVVLKNKLGLEVAKGVTDKTGHVTFENSLLDGTIYTAVVNGVEMTKPVTTGSSTTFFLAGDQIKKEEPKAKQDKTDSAYKEDKPSKESKSAETSSMAADKKSEHDYSNVSKSSYWKRESS